jgi:hypothetical protein
MGCLVVQADAGRAREPVSDKRSGTCAMFRQEPAADVIQFSGGHAGLHLRLHFAQSQGHDAADFLQASQVFFIFDCHNIILLYFGWNINQLPIQYLSCVIYESGSLQMALVRLDQAKDAFGRYVSLDLSSRTSHVGTHPTGVDRQHFDALLF